MGLAVSAQMQVLLGRFSTREEIAVSVLHPVSVESVFIAGTEIIVDAGMSQM